MGTPLTVILTLVVGVLASSPCPAGDLTIDLGNSAGVRFVGVLNRWDADGNPRAPVDPKAKIDGPAVTARATMEADNRWVFHKLPPGRYDVVVLARDSMRIEGFHYPPVAEFDPILPPDASTPADTRDWIIADIAKSKHYENKVTPLFLGGGDKQVRILVQLLRDQPTSYDAEFGAPVATLRHEVWQYTNRYGGWVKDKKTRILDRILMAKSELARWTWVWEPRLGGIVIDSDPVRIAYEIPDNLTPEESRGLLAGLRPASP